MDGAANNDIKNEMFVGEQETMTTVASKWKFMSQPLNWQFITTVTTMQSTQTNLWQFQSNFFYFLFTTIDKQRIEMRNWKRANAIKLTILTRPSVTQSFRIKWKCWAGKSSRKSDTKSSSSFFFYGFFFIQMWNMSAINQYKLNQLVWSTLNNPF